MDIESRRAAFQRKGETSASNFATSMVSLRVLEKTLGDTGHAKGVEHRTETMTGNTTAAYIAYALSDVSTLFPITPSSAMGASVDAWAVAGRKNCFGQVLQVQQMQSEAGAAGALHGLAAAGSLGTTFTASQGLLLMIPDMLRISGCLYPSVIHVATRAISGQGWCINPDHSDVMCVRQTGWAMLFSNNVQDIHDMALVSHLASMKTRIPFLHAFEGFQLSHEVSKIDVLEYDTIKKMIPMDKVYEHRQLGLSPNHPTVRGTVQPIDYFMQATEANQIFWKNAPKIIEETMNEVAAVTGRPLNLFDYHGHPEADVVICIMGASADIVAEAIEYINRETGTKAGCIAVHLYRPWSLEHFMARVPKTCKKMAVLDRTIEYGSIAEPLMLDVVYALAEGRRRDIDVVGGRYGLGGKVFSPMDVKSVLDNLALDEPRNHFIVNVNDDILHSNLPIPKPEDSFLTIPKGTSEAVFWGIGGDGTVSANIEAISLIGGNTDLFAQGQFEYDSHKSGGVTKSHLRFGTSPITSHYPITKATYLACHHHSFVFKFNVLDKLAENGVFVYNTRQTNFAEIDAFIPGSMKHDLAKRNAQFYVIDAIKLAKAVGLGNKTSMILQTVFFGLSGVLPFEKLVPLLKQSIKKAYGKKGQHIVDMNNKAVDLTMDALIKIDYPREEWLKATVERKFILRMDENTSDYVRQVLEPVAGMIGDSLPTSAVTKGGIYPLTATSKVEKRGIAVNVPTWNVDKCTQCNYCSLMCPHSCIRPFLMTQKEKDKLADNAMTTQKAKGVSGFEYRIQVSPYDCTGCEVCVNVCPDDALSMVPFEDSIKAESKRWDYLADVVPNRGELFDKETVKGSQFQQPLMEFPGACEGCGETQYVKLMTQLFGDRMLMSCAAGCNVVWAGSFPTVAYSQDKNGRGPSYGFSLFEDCAEFGYGLSLANRQAQDRAEMRAKAITATDSKIPASSELKRAAAKWVQVRGDAKKMREAADVMLPLLEVEKGKHEDIRDLYEMRDVLGKISHWAIGGDGWAYDIGFGGLDHVVSSGEDINILILDNEVYSNTGGQKSKATPLGAVAKFAAKGKMTHKKDIGTMLMSKGDVYVASVAVGANYQQTLRALIEAEAYPGPSVVIAYSPCIEHGVQGGLGKLQDQTKLAVDSGYWNLWRYNPQLKEKGENPFQLDAGRIRQELATFLKKENRFKRVRAADPGLAEKFSDALTERTKERFDALRLLAQGPASRGDTEIPDVTVLYVSETGTAEGVAKRLGVEASRRGLKVRCVEADEMEVADLKKQKVVLVVASTCGQGETPDNGKLFQKAIGNAVLAADTLKGVKFAVFGLGDSSYVFFNKVAGDIDARLAAIGGERVYECGMGDDQHDDKYYTAFEEWEPEMWMQLGVAEPANVAAPEPEHIVTAVTDATAIEEGIASAGSIYVPEGFIPLQMVRNELLTPPDHDRDIRHYEFSLKGTNMQYSLGDSLAILPRNDEAAVVSFIEQYGNLSVDDVLSIKPRGAVRFPEVITLKKLFTEVLDLFGRPSRVFLKSLLHYVTDEAERKEIASLVSAEGKAAYKAEVVDKLLNFADILLKYKTARPPLDVLLDLIPNIKPRYYSIASSSRADPTKLELCIVLVDWQGGVDGALRTGMTTGFLRSLEPSETNQVFVACRVREATIVVPRDDKTPIIMAGLGTGMAPYRALVQDRAFLKSKGVEAGPLTLYYGCRYEKKEFLYGDWLKEQEEKGVVRLRPAFSRDQAHKVYVTDKIKEDSEHIHSMLVNKGSYFLFCGPSGRQPEDVRKAIISAMAQHGVEESKGEQLIIDWKLSGRYGQETW